MNRIKHIIIIFKLRTGEPLSAEEQRWWQAQKDSEDMERAQKNWDQLWELTKSYKTQYKFEAQNGWKRFRNTHLAPPVARRRQLIRWAAAAVVAMLIGLWGWYAVYQAPETLVLTTEAGEQKNYTLPDGTEIWLNERSKLVIPHNFNKNVRQVQLQGEAYFHVAKDPAHPFIVHTSECRVQVLGTRFNLHAYESQEEVVLYVVEGRVQFQPKSTDQRIILTANQRLRWQPDTRTLVREKDEWGNALSWKTGRFKFRNTPLEEVFRVLSYRYHVQFEWNDKVQLDCGYTNDLYDQDLKTLLATLQKNFPNLQFTQLQNARWHISGYCR